MKVYVVFDAGFDDVLGVFTSRLKAENYIIETDPDLKIKVYEANRTDNKEKIKHYHFVYTMDYELDTCEECVDYCYRPAVREYTALRWIDTYTVMRRQELAFDVIANSEAQAKRIANSRIMMYRHRI